MKEGCFGLNGGKAEVAATYDDSIRLSASAVIVAPGGVWPKKTNAQQAVQPQWVEADEPARQHRLDWLIGQYDAGRMLVAFGFDSLYLGQRERFKGKHFASTDQASVIWFGSDGAQYSPAKAMFSDKNLLTAKPLVGVDDAISLLRQLAKGEPGSTSTATFGVRWTRGGGRLKPWTRPGPAVTQRGAAVEAARFVRATSR